MGHSARIIQLNHAIKHVKKIAVIKCPLCAATFALVINFGRELAWYNLASINRLREETIYSISKSNSVSATHKTFTLRWRHNEHAGVSNHQPHGCLLNSLFRRRSKTTSKLRVTGLCAGNSPGPVNSPHKGPVTRKMFPFDDVIMDRLPCVSPTPQYSNPSSLDVTVTQSDRNQIVKAINGF